MRGSPGKRRISRHCSSQFPQRNTGRAGEGDYTTIAGMAVEEGRVLLVHDAQESAVLRDKKSVRRLQLRSVLCASLIVSNEAFAVIYLENRGLSNQFNGRHEQLLSEICALAGPRLHTAVAIESARQKARDLELAQGESDGIITADPSMSIVLETLAKIAPTELTVLIQGETGTGKELLARAIYRRSPPVAPLSF